MLTSYMYILKYVLHGNKLVCLDKKQIAIKALLT